METMTIIDTSLSSDNLGDEIIMDSVNHILFELFPNTYFFRVASHERLSDRSYKFIEKSKYSFIGGTNALSSHVSATGLWRLALRDVMYLKNAVCLGVGWQRYMPQPNLKARFMMRRILDKNISHAVRDSYAQNRLASVVPRVVNTCCPTTWNLTAEHCKLIPSQKSQTAIFTLTAWSPDASNDRKMMELVLQNYKQVYFFPQMQDDFDYFQSFNMGGVKILSPTIAAYDQFLKNEDVDYIGTRLHAGIRALQMKRRALIIAIDVRGTEIGKDVNLPMLKRGDLDGLQTWIESKYPTNISLPHSVIEEWKNQFLRSK